MPNPPHLRTTSGLPGPAVLTSHLLIAILWSLALLQNLLPGLLAALLGHAFTWALMQGVSVRSAGPVRIAGGKKAGWRHLRLPGPWAASAVCTLPVLAVLGLRNLVPEGGLRAWGPLLSGQWQELLAHAQAAMLSLKGHLPPGLADKLPADTEGVHRALTGLLSQQAGSLARVGESWAHGTLMAIVGLIIGCLVAAARSDAPVVTAAPLRLAMRARGRALAATFNQVMLAQVGIAAFNATLTAGFLYGVLPAFGVEMPHSAALVALTFTAGLLPIVGNLLCNVVITAVGLSVSPVVGASCLAFLMLVHKAEYVISAKIVGKSTSTAAWELLAAIVVGETLFGVAGMVAAPLMYAWAKRELTDARWV